VQIDTTLDDEQSKTGPGNLANVAATVKGLKEVFLVGLRNPAAVVHNAANCVLVSLVDLEIYACARRGVFDGVGDP